MPESVQEPANAESPSEDGDARGRSGESQGHAEVVERGADDEASDVEPLPLSVVFDILKNERRRLALQHILMEDGPFSLGELAEHIAAIENDKPVSALTSSERKRVYVGLYQCHLPRMDDADVVEFERARGTIEAGPNLSQVTHYLALAHEEDAPSDRTDRRWSRYYLLIAMTGAIAFGVVGLLRPPAPVTPDGVMLLFFTAIAGCALLHRYHGLSRSDVEDE